MSDKIELPRPVEKPKRIVIRWKEFTRNEWLICIAVAASLFSLVLIITPTVHTAICPYCRNLKMAETDLQNALEKISRIEGILLERNKQQVRPISNGSLLTNSGADVSLLITALNSNAAVFSTNLPAISSYLESIRDALANGATVVTNSSEIKNDISKIRSALETNNIIISTNFAYFNKNISAITNSVNRVRIAIDNKKISPIDINSLVLQGKEWEKLDGMAEVFG